MKSSVEIRTRCLLVVGVIAAILSSFFAINVSAQCVAPPAGLVSWWRGEANAVDHAGTNNGTLAGDTTYGSGRVGQGFVFDGSGDGVSVGNAPALQLQTFTIEAWIKRGSTTLVSHDPYNSGILLSYPEGGYGFAFWSDGRLFLTQNGSGAVFSTQTVTDTNSHHVAVTRTGSTVMIYVDGVGESVGPYNPTFVFNGPVAIGARGGDLAASFIGTIDEISVYNRALSAGEIQAIYNAGGAGKCVVLIPPSIVSQPTNQTVPVGGIATFSVTAAGTGPLNYQWKLNGTNVSGATAASLVLPNVQLTNAGNYSVTVSNLVGTTNSSSATLTVNGAPGCVPPAAGLVSWWRGELNALDQGGTNNGALLGNTTYGSGRAGQGFVFDGSGDGVSVGNAPALQLQTFTIEAWIKRGSTTLVSHDPYNSGILFSYGPGGYGFAFSGDGRLFLTKNEVGGVFSTITVTDMNLHHVAVTKSGGTVIFYVDGIAETVAAYDPGFVFGGPAAIGARGGDLVASFLGSIDEISIYNRQLSAGEIQAIYNAGGAGKCTGGTAPSIVSQPTNQTVTVSGTAIFSVTAAGTGPLTYQWRLNGTNLNGATAASLVLPNVQLTNAGNYSVTVSNLAGTATSSNAILTVNASTGCVLPPSGLAGWWRGEVNALDQAGTNNGTLAGNTTYGSGRVGQGFVFDGSGDGVSLGDAANLQLQTFTIEAWIKRGSTTLVSHDPHHSGILLSYPEGGYGFAFWDDGRLFLTQNGSSAVFSTQTVTDTNYHHVAVTKTGSTVMFYVDGVGESVAPYNPTFVFGGPVAIGARGGDLVASFIGSIDEISVYNRALSAGEIQTIYTASSAGKCVVAIPPFIISQPTNQTVQVGGTATFAVIAGGTPNLGYQWTRNGTNIAGATADSLTLTNVAFSQAGTYAVVVTNAGGPVTSSNAVLTVILPPATVRVVGVSGPAGGNVAVPVVLVANGNENALGFSLNFDPALLAYTGLNLGSGAPGAALLFNTNQVGAGKLGVAVALPTGGLFAAGTQEVVVVNFALAITLNPASTAISFGDVPIDRQLADALGNTLAATYAAGNVSIAAAEFEGDVSPRPNGDRVLTISDWVLAGRYVARLDYPTNAAEFQRADSAPRATLGDGLITVADYVQAGRYAAKLDPSTPLGGPNSEAPGFLPSSNGHEPSGGAGNLFARQLVVADTMLLQGQPGSVNVRLEAQGDENALGFSLSFDPEAMSYTGASLGAGTDGAILYVNNSQAAQGRLGIVLSLQSGSHFAAGSKEIIKVNFLPGNTASGSYPVSLTQLPVPREVVDANALALSTSYIDGTITVNPRPSLKISRVGQNIVLSWPLWSTNFVLQQSGGGLSSSATWTNLPVSVGVSNNESVVTLPLDDAMKFFRLHQP